MFNREDHQREAGTEKSVPYNMNSEHMVHMANQIALNFQAYPREKAETFLQWLERWGSGKE